MKKKKEKTVSTTETTTTTTTTESSNEIESDSTETEISALQEKLDLLNQRSDLIKAAILKQTRLLLGERAELSRTVTRQKAGQLSVEQREILGELLELQNSLDQLKEDDRSEKTNEAQLAGENILSHPTIIGLDQPADIEEYDIPAIIVDYQDEGGVAVEYDVEIDGYDEITPIIRSPS